MLKWLASHKIIVGLVVMVAVGGVAMYARGKTQTEPLRYVLSPVTRGSLIVSLQGSGQVSGQTQLDVKPKVSGDITMLLIKPGDKIEENAVIAQLENKDAQRGVRDAVQSVADARVSLKSAQQKKKKLKF